MNLQKFIRRVSKGLFARLFVLGVLVFPFIHEAVLQAGDDASGSSAVSTAPALIDRVASDPAQEGPGSATQRVQPKLIQIGAGHCDECLKMIPVLDELGKRCSRFVDIVSYDTGLNSEIGPKHAVRIIPTQVVFDSTGREVARHEGFWAVEEMEKELTRVGIIPGHK